MAGQDSVLLGAVTNTTQALAGGLIYQAELIDTTNAGHVSTQIINFHTGFLQSPDVTFWLGPATNLASRLLRMSGGSSCKEVVNDGR